MKTEFLLFYFIFVLIKMDEDSGCLFFIFYLVNSIWMLTTSNSLLSVCHTQDLFLWIFRNGSACYCNQLYCWKTCIKHRLLHVWFMVTVTAHALILAGCINKNLQGCFFTELHLTTFQLLSFFQLMSEKCEVSLAWDNTGSLAQWLGAWARLADAFCLGKRCRTLLLGT